MGMDYYSIFYKKNRTTYYSKVLKKEMEKFEIQSQIIKAENFSAIRSYVKEKYGDKIEILEGDKKSEQDHIQIKKFSEIPNFEKSDSIEKLLSAESKKYDPISAHIINNEFVTTEEDIGENGKTVVKLLQEGLSLKPQDKIVFMQRIDEGYGTGELHSESGWILTSTDKYAYYWLEYNKERGYYLDPFNVTKVTVIK